jgi:OmpA-OmpF porin, OOP family
LWRNNSYYTKPLVADIYQIKTMKLKFLYLLQVVALVSALTQSTRALAQTADKRWSIGLHGGAMQYKGALGNDFYSTNKAFHGFGGLSVSRYLSRHLGVSALYTQGDIGYSDDVSYFHQQISTITINFRFNFFGPDTFIRPYLLAGGGVMMFDKNAAAPGRRNDAAAPSVGAGINIKLGPDVMFNVQETFMYSTGNTRGGPETGTNDTYLFHSAGFSFNFGKKKDQDADGVADRNDKCENTPTAAKVDSKGCPVDSDNDGIADYLDQCPNVSGLINGCPDTDKDGIADKEDLCPNEAGTLATKGCPDADGDLVVDNKDECPNVKGLLAFAGCPDTDNDGIKDSEDTCPDVAGVKEFMGCPDTDGDGIQDSKDMCPNLKGIAATQGCPDTDLDGVHDGIDKCPAIAGDATNEGCPKVKKETLTLFKQALQGIKFESGKAKIMPVSYPILNAVAKVLEENPSYKLLIGGHTDNLGGEELNQTLSQNRAEAVGAYLIGKGISPLRVSSKGYGFSKPVDTNTTIAGRTRNRRVELSVEFLAPEVKK